MSISDIISLLLISSVLVCASIDENEGTTIGITFTVLGDTVTSMSALGIESSVLMVWVTLGLYESSCVKSNPKVVQGLNEDNSQDTSLLSEKQ